MFSRHFSLVVSIVADRLSRKETPPLTQRQNVYGTCIAVRSTIKPQYTNRVLPCKTPTIGYALDASHFRKTPRHARHAYIRITTTWTIPSMQVGRVAKHGKSPQPTYVSMSMENRRRIYLSMGRLGPPVPVFTVVGCNLRCTKTLDTIFS